MKEYIVRLVPRSVCETTLHSDTLFGAICWGIRTLFGVEKLCSILEEFNTMPPFILSSAFPWRLVKSEHKYYLPKPVLKPITSDEFGRLAEEKMEVQTEAYHSDKVRLIEIANRYKTFKKLKMIPLAAFRKVLKQPSELEFFVDYLDGILKDSTFAESGISQKNSLDRLTHSTAGAGNVFYTNEVSFRGNCGLYFLLKTRNIDEYLVPVLRFLEDSGIGANARTGKNWFEVEIEQKSLFEVFPSGSFVTLSRYIAHESVDEKFSRYQIVSVRSKIESRFEFAGEDIWKDRVTYFAAGSVIRPKEKNQCYGSLVPVKEIAGQTVYQYGYAYPVWMQGGEDAI